VSETQLLNKPDGWNRDWFGGSLMTNLNGTIDRNKEREIRAGGCCGQHAARDFCGEVWFQGGQYHEEVWRHHVHIDTLSADTLEDLMQLVNDKWGWE
jgi:hypothetical protein